ncbi:hypothetical protein LINPERHAP2_LOCUS35969 [Linum perenne]
MRKKTSTVLSWMGRGLLGTTMLSRKSGGQISSWVTLRLTLSVLGSDYPVYHWRILMSVF